MITFIQEAWHTTLLLAPWLFLGAFSAGLVHKVLPAGWMKRHFNGPSGVLKAVTLGIPMPLCSCGVIPAGLSIKKQGGSSGASMAFMISTPQTGIDSILVAASFLGWPLAIFKVALAAVTGIVGGLLGDDIAGQSDATEISATVESTTSPSWKDAYLHAQDLIDTIWGWLVFGILFSAALATIFPPGLIGAETADSLLLSSLLTLLIALPLYVCATASVPIAAALVSAGMPLGSALIFLMAGPATNAATIGTINRTFGLKRTIIYLITIIVGSVGGAFLFEMIWGETAAVQMSNMHEHGFSMVEYVCAVGLLGYLGFFILRDARLFLASKLKPSASNTDATQTVVLPVQGMTCQGCVKKLTRNLEALPEVESVLVDLESASATVSGGITEELIAETVTASGFKVA